MVITIDEGQFFLYESMSRSLTVSHQLLAHRCWKPSTATAVCPVLMDHPLAVCGVRTRECHRSVPRQGRFLHGPAATRLGCSVSFPQSHFAERQQQRQSCAAVRLFQSASEYNTVADDCLENLQDALDEWLEENVNDGSSRADDTTEVVYASGVLTLKLPPHGTWVLNKQSATQQIWWSSPLSGPKRFEYADGAWWSTKDGLNLERQLAQELRHFFPHAAPLKHDGGEAK
jgi:frataxin